MRGMLLSFSSGKAVVGKYNSFLIEVKAHSTGRSSYLIP